MVGWLRISGWKTITPQNILKVGRLEAEILFELIQYSSMLGVWDAVDGVALGYENIDDYESYPESRLHFHFGDTIKDVENKLYEKI
jgi:hypothetical protein